jgi:hypothetical protein
MSLRIVWNYPALAVFYSLRVHEATAVDRAVIQFAETSKGHVARVGHRLRLRVGDFDAVLRVDHEERVLHVLRIYRVR